jgi:2-hydroxycyclohexanecarboxyl-CoA dehydrogenase
MELRPGCAAFITGGASGIGLGIARALASLGVKLVLADVDEERVQATGAALAASGAQVLALPLDVRDEGAWQVAAEAAFKWAGGVQLLFNCAGVVFVGDLTEQPVGQWRATQDVNVTGPYLGVRTFLPGMLASGEAGRIVNVASLAGLWGEYKLAAYSASKFALVGLSEALQLELARTRVGMTVAFPGPTRTNLGASTRRLGEREGLVAPAEPRVASGGTEPRGASGGGMDADAVGRRIVEGVLAGEFYVITHPDWRPLLEARFEALREAFGEPAQAGYSDSGAAVEKITGRLSAALRSGASS